MFPIVYLFHKYDIISMASSTSLSTLMIRKPNLNRKRQKVIPLRTLSKKNEYRLFRLIVAGLTIFLFCRLLNLPRNNSQVPVPLIGNIFQSNSNKDLSHVQQTKIIEFPRKIWQTAKGGIASFDDFDREAIGTWTKLNQKWRHEIVTQHSAESYVRERFSERPDIVEVFTDLQDPILRADMIRYLLLLEEGGLYSDLDTKSLKPIDDWIPPEYQAMVNVVIGIEYDKLDGERWVDWTLDLQFSTWTILAKPRHALFEYTVEKVIRGLKNLALSQDTTVSNVKLSINQVLDITGPAMFTQSVFEVLSYCTGATFSWSNVTNLKAPLLVSDILILPITSFGNGQSHSNSGGPNEDGALVQHLFKGSWKEVYYKEEMLKEENRKKQEEEDLASQV
jgi:alpha 1,6-mannosyltransferase